MPPPLPELMEELMEEVLLRFPPDDPGSLVRAALVCKLWCRLVSGTAFRCRFREFHRGAVSGTFRLSLREFHRSAAPLLSVIYTGNTDNSVKPVRFKPLPVPAASYTRHGLVHAPDGRNWVASDARHGRVLLYRINVNNYPHTRVFSVWNPVTHEQRVLPEQPWSWWKDYCTDVVCAGTAGGNCDHLHCHRGPFLVLVMEIQRVMRLSVYSSETGTWSNLPDFELPHPRRLGWFRRPPAVLVGSALYLLIPLYEEIVKYDFATREVSAIPLPSKICPLKVRILLADDGGHIGFVVEKDFRSLLSPTASSQRNTPGKEAFASSIAIEDDVVPKNAPKHDLKENDVVPASRPQRLRRPNRRVTGPMWQV